MKTINLTIFPDFISAFEGVVRYFRFDRKDVSGGLYFLARSDNKDTAIKKIVTSVVSLLFLRLNKTKFEILAQLKFPYSLFAFVNSLYNFSTYVHLILAIFVEIVKFTKLDACENMVFQSI